MRSAILLFGILLTLLPFRALGQYVSLGSEMQRYDWLSLAGQRSWLIYPRGADSLARVAYGYVERFLPSVAFTPLRGTRFPIVMRARTAVPNGFVAWTPSRMELYPLTAGESATPVPWMRHLISHELRHYAQMQAMNRSWYRAIYFLVGEHNLAVASAQVPRWLFEGDAICIECSLGRAGRLTEANHLAGYRADLLDSARHSYARYALGSLRYNVPNHYAFGAIMVPHAAHYHGDAIWPYVFGYVARRPYTIMPVPIAIKKKTGLWPRSLWRQAIGRADSIWRARTEPGEIPTPIARTAFHDELYPYYDTATRVRYRWEWNLQRTMRLRTLPDSGRGATRLRPGRMQGRPRYRHGRAMWRELNYHARWSAVSYSDVYTTALAGGRTWRLTRGGRYLSPDYMADSTYTAISIDGVGRCHLIRFGGRDGKSDTAAIPGPMEMREATNHPSRLVTLLRWVDDHGAWLGLYDWEGRTWRSIWGPLLADVGDIALSERGLWCMASRNAREQLFHLALDSALTPGSWSRLALANHGASTPTPLEDGRLALSERTINGWRDTVVEPSIHLKPDRGPIPDAPLWSIPKPPAPEVPLDSLPPTPASKRYSAFLHSVRIHSWLPLSFDPFLFPDLRSFAPGVTLSAQNSLSTMFLSAGYYYRSMHGGELSFVYDGWWPQLSTTISYGGERAMRASPDTVTYGPPLLQAQMVLSLPLRWRVGAWSRGVTPTLTIAYDNRQYLYPGVPSHPGIFRMQGGLRLFALRVQALRELYPRWGVSVSGTLGGLVMPTSFFPPDWGVSGTVYLPGVWWAHSLRLSASFRGQMESNTYRQILYIPTRGYGFLQPANTPRGVGGYMLAADYTLPLGYPDADWRVIYLKAIWLNVWGGFSQWSSGGKTPIVGMHRVIGADFDFLFHPLLTEFQCRLVFRVSYSPWGDQLSRMAASNWAFGVSYSFSM